MTVYIFTIYLQMNRKRKRKSTEVLRHVKRFKSRFNNLHEKIESLNSLIGMSDVKECVIDQLKFLLCNDGKTDGHFLHTVISGPSGCGKTTLAKVMHELWSELNVFENNKFTVLHRSDLVGGYMGQTAVKTKKVLNKLIGGCIFIDEFYSLIYSNDSYGMECVDTLNTFMSENENTVVIVAGYEDEMKRVFDAQPGLKRRFAWSFNIKRYTAGELMEIFQKQLDDHGWSLATPRSVKELFKKNYEKFEFQGGDTFNLCLKSKMEYSKRHWKNGGSKKITTDDVERAMKSHFTKEVYNNTMYI
jgi:SpoVK/Ycf46/Vps4 family AAA+-type ATPase